MIARIAPSLLIVLLLAGTTRADEFQHIVNSIIGVKRHLFEQKKPHSVESPTIENVADELDYLEYQIETYGSVVPKQPDIWGEARLTQQRRQYEIELSKRFSEDQFNQTLQGSIRRADLSFLAASLAIGASSGNAPANDGLLAAPDLQDEGISAFDATPSAQLLTGAPSTAELSLEPVVEIAQLSRYLNYINQLRRINEGDDTADAPGYSMNMMRIPVSVLPGKRTREGYGAEITFTATPYLSDDLLPSTIESLVINDLIDSYTQPLVRFYNNDPEFAKFVIDNYYAVNQRKQNWMMVYDAYVDYLRGNGATLEADYVQRYREYMERRLLALSSYARVLELEAKNPDIAIPSLVRGLPESVTIQRGINGEPIKLKVVALAELLDRYSQSFMENARKTEVSVELSNRTNVFSDTVLETKPLIPLIIELISTNLPNGYAPPTQQQKDELIKRLAEVVPDNMLALRFNLDDVGAYRQKYNRNVPAGRPAYPFSGRIIVNSLPTEVSTNIVSIINEVMGWRALAGISVKDLARYFDTAADKVKEKSLLSLLYDSSISIELDTLSTEIPTELFRIGVNAPVRTQTAQRPVPPSMFLNVFGYDYVSRIAADLYPVLRVQPANNRHIHAFDIRLLLGEELGATYLLLKSERYLPLWHMCNPHLADAVRKGDNGELSRLRDEFRREIARIDGHILPNIGPSGRINEALAWAILVEASLVNQRLVEDMQQVAKTRGCACLGGAEEWYVWPLPMLSPSAIESFKEYVSCKWPIYIFTLDPITDDQNISDYLDRRRELQLAVAAAVASGQMNIGGAMRFQRQLETEVETIALNRRAIGFSHGTNTFGWRFYPRVQTPDTPGNLVAFGQTLFGGPGKDADLRQRELEPEMRECTAVVIMPSFVPTLTLESRGNWFSLTNPRCKELTMNDTMKMSRTFQTINNCVHTTTNNGYYRPTDVAQLNSVLLQMEQRLPLQQKLVQIPFENTLGAYDLFDSGVTSLGPELTGWYGAPGIDPNGSTTLFLTGKRFSVLESDLIIGGRRVPFRLLSREVMEVTVPPGVQPLASPEFADLADAHLATPYGPSSHLTIPMNRPSFGAGDRYLWVTSTLNVNLFYKDKKAEFIQSDAPPILQLRSPALGAPTSLTVNLGISANGRLLGNKSVTATFDPRTHQYVIGGLQFQEFASLVTTAANDHFKLKAPSEDQKVNFSVSAAVVISGGIPEPARTPMNLDVTLKLLK